MENYEIHTLIIMSDADDCRKIFLEKKMIKKEEKKNYCKK